MHILVIDGGHVEAELREKFGPAHEYTFHAMRSDSNWLLKGTAATADVAFIFACVEEGFTAMDYIPDSLVPTFIETLYASLAGTYWEAKNGKSQRTFFGFCGLPTLLNRRLLEVSLYQEADRAKLAETCAALGTDYRVVADRVGLVTPRVICQIINEACFTVQEGTATMQDVDLGMKLGTSYPRGPFAWANAIGVDRVYAVLKGLWDDTHDERYKVCPLLKRQALRGEPFAV